MNRWSNTDCTNHTKTSNRLYYRDHVQITTAFFCMHIYIYIYIYNALITGQVYIHVYIIYVQIQCMLYECDVSLTTRGSKSKGRLELSHTPKKLKYVWLLPILCSVLDEESGTYMSMSSVSAIAEQVSKLVLLKPWLWIRRAKGFLAVLRSYLASEASTQRYSEDKHKSMCMHLYICILIKI